MHSADKEIVLMFGLWAVMIMVMITLALGFIVAVLFAIKWVFGL